MPSVPCGVAGATARLSCWRAATACARTGRRSRGALDRLPGHLNRRLWLPAGASRQDRCRHVAIDADNGQACPSRGYDGETLTLYEKLLA